MNKQITCIVCPMGCQMTAVMEGDTITEITGCECKQGKRHAEKEVTRPARVLTTTVKTDKADFPLLPVRSNGEIPKDLLIACMGEIANATVTGSIRIGEPVIENILETGVDIVACRTLPLIN